MRKILLIILSLSLVTPASFAAELESSGPLRKLQRGFLNIVFSPMEISNELAHEKYENADQAPPSWAAGLIRGIGFAAGRAVGGVYDMVTFPIPLPKDYGPVIHPELPWDKFKTSRTIQNR